MTFLVAGRRAADERGTRLHLPQAPPTSRSARPPARPPGSVPGADLSGVVVDTMKVAYPYLEEWRAQIYSVIAARGAPVRAHARRRHRPVRRGAHPADGRRARCRSTRPEELTTDAPVLPGDVAFRLHDTYGFPIDLTIELAAEYGVRVDRQGFDEALAEQRERSRSRHEGRHGPAGRTAAALRRDRRDRAGETKFLGYETTHRRRQGRGDPARRHRIRRARGKVEAELRAPAEAQAEIILDADAVLRARAAARSATTACCAPPTDRPCSTLRTPRGPCPRPDRSSRPLARQGRGRRHADRRG